MFDDNIAFTKILTSLESTLSLEMIGGVTPTETIQAAIERLENTYACKLDSDVYTVQAENQLVAANLNLLLRDLEHCLADVSLYTNLKLFHTNMPISLADTNYLGYAKEQLLTDLKYLMYEKEYKKHADEIVATLYNALNNVPMCSVKRMFLSLLMLHRLGISEGVAILAQLLYVGGLVV